MKLKENLLAAWLLKIYILIFFITDLLTEYCIFQQYVIKYKTANYCVTKISFWDCTSMQCAIVQLYSDGISSVLMS